jgi:hypothetical protein
MSESLRTRKMAPMLPSMSLRGKAGAQKHITKKYKIKESLTSLPGHSLVYFLTFGMAIQHWVHTPLLPQSPYPPPPMPAPCFGVLGSFHAISSKGVCDSVSLLTLE